jgi:hypothetical protein
MSTPPRQTPRFLPTLTEVVRPSELQGSVPALPSDSEKLLQDLQLKVDALVKARVAQELEHLVRSVVAESANAWVADLQIRLHDEVRKLLTEAISAQDELNKFKS